MQESTNKLKKTEMEIARISAEFLNEKSNRESMITVTRTKMNSNMSLCIIYLSVFPADKETEALSFAKRNVNELRKFIKSNISIRRVPFLELKIDEGEKNRIKLAQL